MGLSVQHKEKNPAFFFVCFFTSCSCPCGFHPVVAVWVLAGTFGSIPPPPPRAGSLPRSLTLSTQTSHSCLGHGLRPALQHGCRFVCCAHIIGLPVWCEQFPGGGVAVSHMLPTVHRRLWSAEVESNSGIDLHLMFLVLGWSPVLSGAR